MPSRELGEDISFILYLVPIVASLVYGAYEWYAIASASHTMPGLAFLIVSKSQYLYLISIVAVCIGLIVDVQSVPPQERASVLSANASRMQILSVVVLIVTFAAALSVGHYDVANGFSVFIAGRYALIYAFSIVIISILLVPKQMVGTARASSFAEVIGLILMAASPVVLYAALKIHVDFAVSAIVSIVVGIIGAYLFLNNARLFGKRPEKNLTVQNPQPQQKSTAAKASA